MRPRLSALSCLACLCAGSWGQAGETTQATLMVCRADTAAAARIKSKAAELQRINAGVEHAASMIRFHGGQWRVVLTLEQWARYVKAAGVLR